jgi:hypothetical protein
MDSPDEPLFNCKACFVVRGITSNGGPFLTRELIWPSIDSPEHRRYVKTIMRQKAERMNKAGASVSVRYQELGEDLLWHDADESEERQGQE